MELFKGKKGQGLSLNVIIVAALALIVLVVLVLIFTGRMAVFTDGIGEAGQAQITKYRITYGDCRPSLSSEQAFLNDMSRAKDDSDNQDVLEIEAAEEFEEIVSDCRSAGIDENSCESVSGCKWK
ncbi:hypothetical protein HOC01_02560 [archaeon]|nr:hypothetical protein [archaeon]MBT6697799.1 hypothetical protein [archaeon]